MKPYIFICFLQLHLIPHVLKMQLPSINGLEGEREREREREYEGAKESDIDADVCFSSI